MDRRIRRTCAVLVAAALACSAVGGVAATPAMTDEQAQTDAVTAPAFVVAVQDDGSADVTVTYTFDLTDDVRRAAFEELRTSEEAAQSFEDRFRSRLQGVASDAANATGREMSITDVEIAFETDGETGIVRLTATWDGLAATDGDRLTVTEPFASGFEPERTFAVVVPEGYAVESVSPAPDQRAERRLTWDAGTDLGGFEVTAGPTGDGTATPASDGSSSDGGDGDSTTGDGSETPGGNGPGFGLVAGLLALVAAALLATRR